ncbi:uncharacterized protein HKW66_Vig0027350 [Vigna angularis]|uniref:Uncharacterized protein n=1 Tax=Phaseolus angularis TaxID=3914 RepID=A0A8T0LCF9_PHAAN|nr:uncharacterized protein HKW66_Vig0027350 [Vigna angularis]
MDVGMTVEGELEYVSVELFPQVGGSGFGAGLKEKGEDEDVGVLDGMEERERVGEVLGRGKGAELNELALSEEGIVETRFDDEGMDLFEGSDVGAIGEERLVERERERGEIFSPKLAGIVGNHWEEVESEV